MAIANLYEPGANVCGALAQLATAQPFA